MSLIIYNTGYVFSRSAQVPQMAIFDSSQLEKLTFFYILSCFNSVLGTKDFMVRTCFFYHSLAIIFDLQIKVVSYIDVNSVLKFRFVFFP